MNFGERNHTPKKIEEDEYEIPEEWASLSEKLNLGKELSPEYGPLRLDIRGQRVSALDTGKEEYLTETEFLILWILVRAQGSLVRVAEIEEFLYRDISNEDDRPEGNTVSVLIGKIRKKLAKITSSAQIMAGRKYQTEYQLEIS